MIIKQSQRIGSIARVTTVGVVTVGLIAFALAASAASLGGIAVGTIFTQETTVEIEIPDPIVSTNFSGCTNFIDGWIDESGATWTSHAGNWQCLGHDVVRAQRRVPLANLTVDIQKSTGIRVSTDIFDISHQNNRSGPGLSLLGDDSGNFLYIIYRRDDQELLIGESGESPFTTVTSLGNIASATMSALIEGDLLTVELAGVTVGPFDLTTEAPDLIGNPRFGLVANNDNFSKFNVFTIEWLP